MAFTPKKKFVSKVWFPSVLKEAVSFSGIGLHSGRDVVIHVHPLPVGSGVIFCRSDIYNSLVGSGSHQISDFIEIIINNIKEKEHELDISFLSSVDLFPWLVRASYEYVSNTMLCTSITNKHGITVRTIEHIMSALMMVGCCDAIIVLNADEIPIMDGSAKVFVQAFMKKSVLQIMHKSLSRSRRFLKIIRPICVKIKDQDKDKSVFLEPCNSFKITITIDFKSRFIGKQVHSIDVYEEDICKNISPARTFGLFQEVAFLQEQGLILGGSLDNAIVVQDDKILNQDGLRMPDEFVRHKILDALGDLALIGAPILGHYKGSKPSHAMNNMLLRHLFKQQDAFVYVDYIDVF